MSDKTPKEKTWLSSLMQFLALLIGLLLSPIPLLIPLGFSIFELGTVGLWLVYVCFGLVLGFPVFVLLRHYDWLRWWSATLFGVFNLFAHRELIVPTGVELDLSGLINGFVFGGSIGFLFWAGWKICGGRDLEQFDHQNTWLLYLIVCVSTLYMIVHLLLTKQIKLHFVLPIIFGTIYALVWTVNDSSLTALISPLIGIGSAFLVSVAVYFAKRTENIG